MSAGSTIPVKPVILQKEDGNSKEKKSTKKIYFSFRSESPLSAPFCIALKHSKKECSCSISKRSQTCRDHCISCYFGEKKGCGGWETPREQQKDFLKGLTCSVHRTSLVQFTGSLETWTCPWWFMWGDCYWTGWFCCKSSFLQSSEALVKRIKVHTKVRKLLWGDSYLFAEHIVSRNLWCKPVSASLQLVL